MRRDHGTEVANRVARRSVVAPWREGGQSQFIERPVPADGDSGTAATRAWAVERLDEPLTLADLAAHARMSVRTFTRRFREETGTSPQQWLAAQRLALARQLLESTDHPVDRIAADAGFGTAASLRGAAPGVDRRLAADLSPHVPGPGRSPDVTGDSPARSEQAGPDLWLSRTYRRRPRSSGAAGIDVGLRLRHRGAPGCPTSR